METAAYFATKTLLKNGISVLPITQDELEQILVSKGFTVVPYSLPLSEKRRKFFDLHGVTALAENYPAFTKGDANGGIVGYRIDYSMQERIFLLAHELGHISIGHLSSPAIAHKTSDSLTALQEQEADDFAIHLLAPVCILKQCSIRDVQSIERFTLLNRHYAEIAAGKINSHNLYTPEEKVLCEYFKKYISGTKKILKRNRCKAILIMCTVLSVVYVSGALTTFYANNPPTIPVQDESESIIQSTQPAQVQSSPPSSNHDNFVCVTPDGEKYHKENCPTISRSNVTKITLEEAISLKYEPCKFCYPEE